MPRPRSLTDTDIARAALTVIDRDGLAALSMRSVAAQLDVSPMALYRYVEGRADVERIVAESVLAEVEVGFGGDPEPAEQIVVLLQRVRAAVSAHPGAVPLFLAHRHQSAGSLRWIEAMLTALTSMGFSGIGRVVAQRSLVAFLVGNLQLRLSSPLHGPGTLTLADLPSSSYPLLAETARTAIDLTDDREFEAGLRALLAGLHAFASTAQAQATIPWSSANTLRHTDAQNT
ncbi:TetR/AcrR family transcriptional regulator [Nocardia huaxiensis]|uniref:TetR/AcrR family transcriptional regulator n=1 Tax=Nocardia huaxiensis TaxID=2755382 RepID=UPI001E28C4C2|nr:TetR/AcrR family transcriptional regulator C-terminal domain-containing protein [Nocardia huaxiensis]UFS97084.1 TetR/AcrR family transcriptional regulator C-terminal domain-containing protein [Nocardia huaxiensis]